MISAYHGLQYNATHITVCSLWKYNYLIIAKRKSDSKPNQMVHNTVTAVGGECADFVGLHASAPTPWY